MKLCASLEQSIAEKVGLSIQEIRQKSPSEIATFIEGKTKKKLTFSSQFPFIGRGNVLRDGVKTSQDIDKDIDRILGL
jgi:hypothetical protein